MVRLLTVIMLFSSFAAMADSLSKSDYQNWQFNLNAAPPHSATRPISLHFRFAHDNVGGRWNVSDDLLRPQFSSVIVEEDNMHDAMGLRQYDAALSYPMTKDGMNFDLGLNIRVYEGNAFSSMSAQSQQHNFREAVPMFYAAALFELPFKGLSAGFVGRHSDSLINPSFDYKAKLSYQWADGLGLEGGWQHQQYANDELNRLQNSLDAKGVFLDLRLKF